MRYRVVSEMSLLSCFKAYDIRGRLGDELNEDIAYRIGRAYSEFLQPSQVVVGSDPRLSSPALKHALARGLMDGGANVIDIGLAGTEEVYFAVFHLGVDGGVEVTANHNPMDYNGMKLVQKDSKPISGDSGLRAIQQLAEQNNFAEPVNVGSYSQLDILDAYTAHLLQYIQPERLKPLKLVVNAGNGAAGHVIDKLEVLFADLAIPVQFFKIQHEPDGHFPNGIPNPLLPERRQATVDAILLHQADMGIAWDGDFDRCFLFDEAGEFIEGYYIVGLLAEAFLRKNPGEKIIHDPRLTWNTIDIALAAGGQPVQCKTGHAFIKERMREENAVYGGEMSAHHYFRDFAYCDSGMIPWLLVAELMSVQQQPLSQLVKQCQDAFPCSGELNYRVSNAAVVRERVMAYFTSTAATDSSQQFKLDMTDGIGLEFSAWRFNLRSSNTEPLLRLNVETRANALLLTEKVALLESLIQQEGDALV